MLEIEVKTTGRTEFVNITASVAAALAQADWRAASVTVFVPHTTAGIMLNENADPDVLADLEAMLDKMAPWSGGYRHAEGNSAAHAKAALLGSSVSVPVERARLKLGTWQGIFFCEFDGPRRRKVWIF